MKDRRSFLRMMAVGLVALTVIVAPAIADELIGFISKVDVDGKKLTVVEQGTDKEVSVTVTGDTEYVTGKGSSKLDLEKLNKNVTKSIDAGKKGVRAKIEHDKNVASKITIQQKKKAAQ